MVDSVLLRVALQGDIEWRNVQRTDWQVDSDVHLIKHGHAQEIE